MFRIVAAAALISLSLGMHPSGATPITYTLTGDLTGTLTDPSSGVITFTDQAFEWQVTGDTALVTSIVGPPPGPAIAAETDTLTIGATVLTPAVQTYFAWASIPSPPFPAPTGIGGFSDTTTSQGIAWDASSLFGYDGVSSLGPLAVSFEIFGPLPTDAGTLDVTSASGLVFTAELDEPSPVALLLVGIAGCAVLRRLAIRANSVPADA